MPSINLRQLRNTRQLKAWLRAGETVELRERDKLLARIVPELDGHPDFAARRKAMFGNRVFKNMVLEERKESRY